MKMTEVTTDRELLELAAKAAGDDIKWDSVEACWYTETDDYPGNPAWNPLTDDGDALRLAVEIGWIPSRVEFVGLAMSQDPYATTRRAIVRAAAEIGKKLV